jgi:hypothetical protein
VDTARLNLSTRSQPHEHHKSGIGGLNRSTQPPGIPDSLEYQPGANRCGTGGARVEWWDREHRPSLTAATLHLRSWLDAAAGGRPGQLQVSANTGIATGATPSGYGRASCFAAPLSRHPFSSQGGPFHETFSVKFERVEEQYDVAQTVFKGVPVVRWGVLPLKCICLPSPATTPTEKGSARQLWPEHRKKRSLAAGTG